MTETYLELSPLEREAYDTIVSIVKMNLIITNLDKNLPGELHPDSLLNPKNRSFYYLLFIIILKKD